MPCSKSATAVSRSMSDDSSFLTMRSNSARPFSKLMTWPYLVEFHMITRPINTNTEQASAVYKIGVAGAFDNSMRPTSAKFIKLSSICDT